MGERYAIQLKCAYCGHLNTDLMYAESCNWTSFDCQKCKKVNDIEMSIDFKAKKREEE